MSERGRESTARPGGRAIVAAIDCAPKGTTAIDAQDYTAHQMYGLTAWPLYTWNARTRTVEPLGAAAHRESADGRVHELQIAEGFWSDGVRVSAEQYAAGILRNLQSRKTVSWIYLRDIEGYNPREATRTGRIDGISHHNDTLVLRFRRPHRFVPHVLSCINFSPYRGDGGPHSAGAYAVTEGDIFWQNSFLPASGGAGSVEHVSQISFRCVQTPQEGLELYHSGELDITCDTFFPYDALDAYAETSHFLSLRPAVYALLRVHNTAGILATASDRRAFARLINREAIRELLHPSVRSLDGFTGEEPAPGAPALLKLAGALRGHVRLGYHDFYPNRIIVEAVGTQLRAAGITTELIAEDYLAQGCSSDVRLELGFLPFHDPFAFYSCEVYSRVFASDRDEWLRYMSLLDRYQVEPDAAQRLSIARRLHESLIESSHVVPLFWLPRAVLRRPGLAHGDFSVGKLMNYES